jgi:small subunit ribosomal protein S6e
MVKVVFNDIKKGRSYQKEFELDLFSSKKIGDKVNGDVLGLKDYEFLITGGSDNAGFPLNDSFDSPVRKRILVNEKGMKIRKNVRGNTFGPYMAQINMKVVKYGSTDLAKALGIEVKAEVPAEQPKVEEKPKEEVKVEETRDEVK